MAIVPVPNVAVPVVEDPMVALPVQGQQLLDEVEYHQVEYSHWAKEAKRRRASFGKAREARKRTLRDWTFAKRVKRKMMRRLARQITPSGRVAVCADALDELMAGPPDDASEDIPNMVILPPM